MIAIVLPLIKTLYNGFTFLNEPVIVVFHKISGNFPSSKKHFHYFNVERKFHQSHFNTWIIGKCIE